jgi:hypothetical protein
LINLTLTPACSSTRRANRSAIGMGRAQSIHERENRVMNFGVESF